MKTKYHREGTAFSHKYGTWAVVTGASSGIGQSIAVELATRGLNIVLVARRQGLLDELALLLQSRFEVETKVVNLDLACINASQALELATAELDVGLFVAAAGFGTSGSFLDARLEDEFNMLSVNCRAVLSLTHYFGQLFAKRGRGGIILFGSLVGYQGTPQAAHYAATKAYVQTLAEGLHVELGPKGVDVLASAPGPVNSGFAARARMQMGQAESPESVARATVQALGKKMTVTPGLLSKFLTWSLMTAPRSLRVRTMGLIMGGMTKHQVSISGG